MVTIMTSIIERLPTEVLLLICESLATASPASLARFCLTCTSLQDLGNPVLYRDVHLVSQYNNRSPLLLFSDGICLHQNQVSSLELSFSKSHLAAFRLGVLSARSYLLQATAMLPVLSRLKTFILNQPPADHRNATLPGYAVAHLIRHLPETVVNLEIDTGGIEKTEGNNLFHPHPPQCFCADISDILPRLYHLRLRKGCLCLEALAAINLRVNGVDEGREFKPLPLRSITIRLDMDRMLEFATQNTWCCRIEQTDLDCSVLARSLHTAFGKGILPSLKRALVVSRFGSRQQFTTARCTKHSGIAVHDVIHNRHILVPVIAVDSMVKKPDNIMVDGFYTARDQLGVDHCADYRSIVSTIEANIPFRTLIGLSSLPAYSFDISTIPRLTYGQIHGKLRMTIWGREAATGQSLIGLQEVHGLAQPPLALYEAVPQGFRYKEPNVLVKC